MRLYVYYEEDGIPMYFSEDGIEVIVVDDRCPHDRVFSFRTTTPPQALLESIQDEYIGHKDDARQKKLIADIEGKSFLTEIKEK